MAASGRPLRTAGGERAAGRTTTTVSGTGPGLAIPPFAVVGGLLILALIGYCCFALLKKRKSASKKNTTFVEKYDVRQMEDQNHGSMSTASTQVPPAPTTNTASVNGTRLNGGSVTAVAAKHAANHSPSLTKTTTKGQCLPPVHYPLPMLMVDISARGV